MGSGSQMAQIHFVNNTCCSQNMTSGECKYKMVWEKKKKLENFRYYASNFKWGICLVAQQRKQMVVNQTLNYYTFDQLKFTTLCNKY